MVSPRTPSPKEGLAILRRAIRVLKAFTDKKPEWGVRELAAELDMDPAAIHRILQTFMLEGFLHHNGQSRPNYHVGFELYRMGSRIQQTFPLTHLAKPIMRELMEECGETVLLGLYDPVRVAVSFVAQVESDHPIRYVLKFGDVDQIHAGASGRAILAFLPNATVDALLKSRLAQITRRTATDAEELRGLLAETRRLGYSFSIGERIEDAVGVAAPVWDSGGVVGAISVTMPKSRYLPGMEEKIGPKIREAAERLSMMLGKKRLGGAQESS